MKRTIKQFAENITYKPLKDALMDKLMGRMSQEELEGISFQWAYEYAFKDLKYKLLPATPFQVISFYKKTDKQRTKILENSNSRSGLDRFWNEESRLKAINGSNKFFLEDMLTYFRTKDEPEKVLQVQGVLNGYC